MESSVSQSSKGLFPPIQTLHISSPDTPSQSAKGLRNNIFTTTTNTGSSKNLYANINNNNNNNDLPPIAQPSHGSEKRKTPIKQKPKNCLVVEDSKMIQKMIQRGLQMEGIECDFANNGLEAITACSQNSSKYDFIIMVNNSNIYIVYRI